MQRGLKMSLAAGDLAFAAYSHRGLVSVRLFCGDPLQDVCRDAEQGLAFFRQTSGFELSRRIPDRAKKFRAQPDGARREE